VNSLPSDPERSKSTIERPTPPPFDKIKDLFLIDIQAYMQGNMDNVLPAYGGGLEGARQEKLTQLMRAHGGLEELSIDQVESFVQEAKSITVESVIAERLFKHVFLFARGGTLFEINQNFSCDDITEKTDIDPHRIAELEVVLPEMIDELLKIFGNPYFHTSDGNSVKVNESSSKEERTRAKVLLRAFCQRFYKETIHKPTLYPDYSAKLAKRLVNSLSGELIADDDISNRNFYFEASKNILNYEDISRVAYDCAHYVRENGQGLNDNELEAVLREAQAIILNEEDRV
jgi:hypothetical protein